MPSDSVLLYNDFLNFRDRIFYGGKALSAEEKRLIPKENKDSLKPDSGIFLACYSFEIDSLYTGFIISHPDRYFPKEYYFYLYNKKINLMTNNRNLLAIDTTPGSAKYLVVKRNKSGIPVSISVQNNYFEDIKHPDSLTGGGRFEYFFNHEIDLRKVF